MPPKNVLLGRYEVHESFDRGANGVVYKAYDTAENRLVAIREVKKYSHIPLKHAEREWKLSQRLKHEGIAQYYAREETEDRLYLVREWVEGQTIREIGKLGPQERDDIMRQVVPTVEYCHGEEAVLRDLKASNLVRMKDGRVKIIELGGAISIGERDDVSSISTLGAAGSYYSTDPEVWSGAVSPLSDIYSLGYLLAEMSLGRTIAPEELRQQGFSQIPSDAHRKIIEKAMERDPARRFQSAAELKVALLGVKDTIAESHESAIAELEQKMAMVRGLSNLKGASILGFIGAAVGFVPFCAISHGSIISSLAGAVVGAGLGVGLSCLLQHLSGRKALRELGIELREKKLQLAPVEKTEADWSRLDLKDVEVLIPQDKGLGLLETLGLAEEKGYVIVPDEVYQRFLPEDPRRLRDAYPARTGTFAITAGQGKKLPEKIIYEGMKFEVPKQYVGQEIVLSVDHPHFKIEGNWLVADARHIHQFELPKENSYQSDSAWLGLLVRLGNSWSAYNRRRVGAIYRASRRFGVAAIKRDVYDRLPKKA